MQLHSPNHNPPPDDSKQVKYHNLRFWSQRLKSKHAISWTRLIKSTNKLTVLPESHLLALFHCEYHIKMHTLGDKRYTLIKLDRMISEGNQFSCEQQHVFSCLLLILMFFWPGPEAGNIIKCYY